MNIYLLVDTRANNFIPDKYKICYINKDNALGIQKIMKEKHNTPLKLVEFQIADSLMLKMEEDIDINDDKYKWRKRDESNEEPKESNDRQKLVI
tara:strand:+ start:2083 stop:2364 length:282 start_codon:yes stop_codon:yes gene_type:complete